MSRRSLSLLCAAAGLLCVAVPARAQCPDGLPPPCGTRVTAARRPAAQPLDERTWIVLPFANVAGGTGTEWLRDASANLLYLDLAKWRDLRVVDDERVADMLRDLRTAQRGLVGLEAGMTVARRAGAGRLVMGDILRVGARTALVAKVYDVRGGQRLRSVREEAASDEDLLPAFSRLARTILNVPAAPAGEAGTVGTASLAAYQEYIAGVRALNTWAIPEAESRFRRAIELDSGFALAHYKLRVVYGWEQRRDEEAGRRHAEAAARLGTGLPARERGLISGMVAQTAGRWGQACEIYTAMLASDSTDVEAWYNLGECSFHDGEVVAAAADTSRVAFRSSWNTALKALARTLALDPSYHLAYRHVQDILVSRSRFGCRGVQAQACAVRYEAIVLRDADTLLTAPLVRGSPELAALQRSPGAEQARRSNLRLARDNADRWVAAGPGEWAARERYASVLMQLGDPQGALRELEAGEPGSSEERVSRAVLRVEALLKSDRAEDAARLADSLSSGAQPDADDRLGTSILFGRFGTVRAVLPPQLPSTVGDFVIERLRAAAGVFSESYESSERAFAALPMPPVLRQDLLGFGTLVSFRFRGTGLALDTASRDPRLRFQAVLAARDTTRARRLLADMDSALVTLPQGAGDGGAFWFSAESHLALGDSATALQRLRSFESRWAMMPLFTPIANFQNTPPAAVLWGRTWLLHGDLAMAAGQRAEASRAYRRVVGLWSHADPELQPLVARARAALNQLQ